MDILTAIGSKIGEYLVEGTIHQARYLFCFNSIVEDLKNEETNLKAAHDDIKKEVERDEKNTKEITKVGEKWLKDAGDVMADVQRLTDEIEAKKSCLNGWCPNWGCRYWLSRKAKKKTSIMLKLQISADKFKAPKLAHPTPLPGIEFSAPTDLMPFKATELARDQLIAALKNENIKKVGLYGVGGVGKTTLATAVGQELEQQQVFDEVVIATVSQNPNILDVQTKLAGQLGLELKEVTKEERAQRLHLRFTTDPKSKILVILDDVWKQHDLKNEFGIPVDDNLNGRKILLTTRRKQVCDRMGCNPSIPLGFLQPEEGLALLKYHAGIDGHDSTLIDVSKEVAGECKGLPLAIVAVGSALRGKDVDEWKLVSQKLKTAKLNEVDDVDNVDVYACLKLSYDYVKDGNAKLCFLLCSLFPEDFEIDLEELVRYGVGLGCYSGVETIEKARSLFRGMIKGLKDSSLLLDAGKEGFVKMHDVVRDVAIQIGLKEEKFFNGVGLTEWPQDEGLKQCRAISLLRNKKNVLPPNGLVCPNLHTLILGNDELFSRGKFIVPDQFFEGMTALKVVNIRGGDLSIKSLQFLTDLQVLQLIACKVRDIAFLGKLKRLQILSLKWSFGDEIPDDLAVEISKLKLLDLNVYVGLEVRISLIKRFSQLQEFYGRMTREVGGTNAECLSKDFAFPQLQRYEIFIGEAFCYAPGHGRTNALSINNTEATSLIIFSALYQNVQNLYLKKVKGCQNILPNIDQRGLKELTDLELHECEDLECIMDVSQNVKSQSLVMLSRLATLRLIDLQKLQWIWKAPAQHVDLQNLTEVEVTKCNNLTYLFSLSQARSLLQLRILKVEECEELEHIIEAKIDNNERRKNILEEEADYTIALPMLKKLILCFLPNLTTTFCLTGIADEFVQAKHLQLRNLTEVEVTECNSLTYLFSLSQALSLVQLKELKVEECEKLEHIIEAKIDNNERRKNILQGDEYTIALPMLKELKLSSLPNLTTTFCLTGIADEFVQAKHLELRNLTEVGVSDCNSLTYLFSLSQARSLVQLKELKVEQCKKLEHIIEAKIDNNERRKNILQGDEYTIALPMLKELKLRSLPNLTTTFCLTGIADEFVQAKHLDLRNLTEVNVTSCNSLTYLFSLSQARSLVQLRSLVVSECEKLEHIIEAKIDNNGRRENIVEGDEYTIALPMLEELELESLPNLTTFSSEGYFPTCQALQELSLISCPRLTCGVDEFVQAENLQYLRLEEVKGCQNILQSIDQRGFYELTTLIVRDCEDIECIVDASQRVGLQKMTVLPKLRELTLEFLPNLTTFCSKYDHSIWPALQYLTLVDCPRLTINTDEFVQNLAEHLDLRNLTEVEVKGCNRLTYLFSLSQARSLVHLEKLKVKECEKLEHIIEAKFDDNERRKYIFGGDEYTIVLPMLKKLKLVSLPNLTTLSSEGCFPTCQALQKLSLISCPRLTDGTDEFVHNLAENLKYLRVERCYHLYDEIVALLKHGLKNLEHLCIGDFGAQVGFQLSDIIVEGQESKLFPSFRRLGLYGLREMEVLYKGPKHFFCSLQNLTGLYVQGCDRLRHLLTPTLARNLLQLVMLSIHRCSELEQIIKEDEEEDHRPPVCFPKLETIDVQLCPKLKRLFHISVAPSLQKLDELHLVRVDELEEVFWHKDGAVGMNDSKIVMTELWELELKDLPNLTNCWPEGHQLTFPSLDYKTIENCPKLRTNFAAEELQTTSKGDASEDRNTKENSSTVGDANKRGDAN